MTKAGRQAGRGRETGGREEREGESGRGRERERGRGREGAGGGERAIIYHMRKRRCYTCRSLTCPLCRW